jgi:LysM repeat protein
MKKLALFVLAIALVTAFGCAKKQTAAQTEPVAQEQAVEEPMAEPEPTPEPVAEAEPTAQELYDQRYAALPTTYTVEKGDALWWIAEFQQIYNDPFMWPLIYQANRSQISNPNLIEPGQVLEIPRSGFTLQDIKAARKMAGAPWGNLEPAETSVLPSDIRSELGYGF